MTSTAIFYGTTTGNTQEVAEQIQQQLGSLCEMSKDICEAELEEMLKYNNLILGISTWNIGDMQSDWEDLCEHLDGADFTGKRIALFGCGDQYGYPDTFGDALGLLWEQLEARGAQLVGRWPTEGYDFGESLARSGDSFLGLLIDFENQPELNEERIERWTQQLQNELSE